MPNWQDRAKQIEDQALQQGNNLQRQAGETAQQYQTRMQQMQAAGDNAIGAIAAQPGYSPGQQGQINYDYTQLQTPSDQLNTRYLTGDEQNAIAGDPYKAMAAYDPSAIEGITGQNTQWQSDALHQQESQLNQNNAQTKTSLDQAANNPNLQVSQDYLNGTSAQLADTQGGISNALHTTQGNVRGSIANNLSDYKLTPKQQQDIVTQAGISAGVGNKAAQDTLQRQAAAAGSSPQGVAAYRARMDQQSAANASDAMTSARIQASNAAAAREMGLTNVQTQNEQELGNEVVGAQLESGQMGQNVLNTQEQAKEGAARDISQRQMTAATTEGQQGNQAAEYAGTSRLNAEQSMNNMNLSGEQYLQNTGQNLLAQGEQNAANRANALAANRQGTTADVQNTGFNQGMAAHGATGQGATTTGNADIAGRNQVANYWTGQQQQAQQGQLGSTGQQISAYGGTYGAATGAQNSGTGAAQLPGTWQKAAGMATGAIAALEDGAVVTEPGVYNVGEAGDEAIVPLNSRPSAAATPDPSYSYLRAMGKGAQAQQNKGQTDPWNQIGRNIGGAIGGALTNYRARQADAGSGENGSPAPDTEDATPENFAVGGIAMRPTMANLGERGAEAVVPLRNGARSQLKTAQPEATDQGPDQTAQDSQGGGGSAADDQGTDQTAQASTTPAQPQAQSQLETAPAPAANPNPGQPQTQSPSPIPSPMRNSFYGEGAQYGQPQGGYGRGSQPSYGQGNGGYRPQGNQGGYGGGYGQQSNNSRMGYQQSQQPSWGGGQSNNSRMAYQQPAWGGSQYGRPDSGGWQQQGYQSGGQRGYQGGGQYGQPQGGGYRQQPQGGGYRQQPQGGGYSQPGYQGSRYQGSQQPSSQPAYQGNPYGNTPNRQPQGQPSQQQQPWFRGASPMAQGRIVTQPTTALIGENGPEAVVPLNGRQDATTRPSLAFGNEVLRRGKMPTIPGALAHPRRGSNVPMR